MQAVMSCVHSALVGHSGEPRVFGKSGFTVSIACPNKDKCGHISLNAG